MKEEFLLEIKNIVAMDEIPHELIINYDLINYDQMVLTRSRDGAL